MELLLESPTVVPALAACLLWIFWKAFLEPSILPDLPIVGLDRSQWFAWPRTIHRAFNSYREIYSEAYEKVCRCKFLPLSECAISCQFVQTLC